jgi:outer membrane protein OmpA-like peptidoglycan-associated protein
MPPSLGDWPRRMPARDRAVLPRCARSARHYSRRFQGFAAFALVPDLKLPASMNSSKIAFATLPLLISLVAPAAPALADDPPDAMDETRTSRHVAESRVHFAFDSAELSDAARAELDEAARWIENSEVGLILIEGHTDKVGEPTYNKDLGNRRADATRSYLIARGVPASRIRVLSYGEGLPALETEHSARVNRRIVLFAVQKEAGVAEAAWIRPTPRPLDLQVLVGGGIVDFIEDTTDELTDTGGTWDARVSFRSSSMLGFEAAYVGSVQGANMQAGESATLLGNGLEGAVRLNVLPAARLRPYLFTGLGWTRYDVTNRSADTLSLDDDDNVLVLPAGVGLGVPLTRSLVLDVRGTVRGAFADQLFDSMNGGEEVGLDSWSTSARLGYEF